MGYAAFVPPGLLASSCMNGAITDGFFNIFFKLHFQKTYDGILATPMRGAGHRVRRDAVGGGARVPLCGGLPGRALVMGRVLGQPLLLSPWAVLALPAAVLVSASFSAMALCITSFVRRSRISTS